MIYIVFGVSGIGKTSIGKLLAIQLVIPFYDADDFHPKVNIEKMSEGKPLNDLDREPWLKLLGTKIKEWNDYKGTVLACSALKESYREMLQTIPNSETKWILLHEGIVIVLERLNKRKEHFFDGKLLKNQFDTLEFPSYGIQIKATQSPEKIVKKIIVKMKKKSTFGLIGLGVMGKSLALNIAGKGTSIAVYNRHIPNKEVDIAKSFVEKNDALKIEGFDNLKQFVNSLEIPRNILLMVNAGKPVDAIIKDLLPYLDSNDLIMDGGNSHYTNTKRRIEELETVGVHFIGMGVSGGEEGALKGPSIMPSGSKEVYNRIRSIIEGISAKDKNGNDCCVYLGPDGAGHFVKMIHNGIEYGEMQLLAEVYHLFRFHSGKSPGEISSIFEIWKKEGLNSYLLEITISILKKKEGEDFLIDKILDRASQKGTGGWSTNAALELGKPLNTIAESVMARYISAMKDTRVMASKLYKSSEKGQVSMVISELKSAYESARIINHAIGFDAISAASQEYNWNLDLSEIARVWTNGCIIRSELMEVLVTIFKDSDMHLLLHPSIVTVLDKKNSKYAKIIGEALAARCSIPVLSSGLNYFLGFISEQSSANMIQAQRDFFGAHTYRRVDRPFEEVFHTNW
jgi:6-phosphogluconate dehydrogenase